MQVAGTAAGSGAGGRESVSEEDPAAATKKRGRPKKGQPKKGQPSPHQTALPLVALLPELSPKEVTKRRAKVPRKKRKKGKTKPGNGRWVGGGTVAEHAHPHFARTDGVGLCIAYRYGEATAMCSPEELMKRLDQMGQDVDRDKWTVTTGPSSSSSRRQGHKRKLEEGEGGSSNTGRGELADDQGQLRKNWPEGDKAAQLLPPVLAACDPGRANLAFFACRTAQAEDLQPQSLPIKPLAREFLCAFVYMCAFMMLTCVHCWKVRRSQQA